MKLLMSILMIKMTLFRLFPVHKHVLAAASPVLASLIEGVEKKKDIHENKEVIDYSEVKEISMESPIKLSSKVPNNTATKHSDDKLNDVIVIPDLPPATVSAILHYIYTGSVDDLSLSCHHLVWASTIYQVYTYIHIYTYYIYIRGTRF